MEFISEVDAKEQGLMQLTEWLFDNMESRRICTVWYEQVLMNKGRIAKYVRHKLGARIAVFVDRVAKDED